MTRRAAVLLLFVCLAMAAGFIAGYRLRISEEEVFTHPPEWKHPKPPARVTMAGPGFEVTGDFYPDTEYDGNAWHTLWPVS